MSIAGQRRSTMKLYREEIHRVYLDEKEVPGDVDIFDWLRTKNIDLGQSSSCSYDKLYHRYDVVTLHEVK